MIFGLINDESLKSSFVFINERLQPYKDYLYYMPLETEQINVTIESQKTNADLVRPENHFKVHSIKVNGNDIRKEVYPYISHWNFYYLKNAIVSMLFAPEAFVKFEGTVGEDNATFEF